MKAWSRAFNKKHNMMFISRYRKISFKIYESTISPILRFLHIRKLDPIGWIKIANNKTREIKHGKKGTGSININCNWTDVNPVECSDIHRFRILSYDIECISGDGKFPQPQRDDDKVIQIGMTYNYLGESECYEKIILCLGDTDDIPGAKVICY